MVHVCSVVLTCRSFDIYHEQTCLNLKKDSIILMDEKLAYKIPQNCSWVRRLNIDECIVSNYLQHIRHPAQYSGKHTRHRLLINHQPPLPLVRAIFDSFDAEETLTPTLSNMLYFSCLSLFSMHDELVPLLFNSINTLSGKVEQIISVDTSRRWYLRDVAEKLYTSESLTKKKLQDENTSFSKILLASRMARAKTLLELKKMPLTVIAEKCGYSSTSYFINTFRQYYGVTPHQYSHRSAASFVSLC